VPVFSLNLMMGLFCSWYGWSREQDRYARTTTHYWSSTSSSSS
jgi:hypothetical protein